MEYSIIIPIYNEGKNILKLSRLLKKHLRKKTFEVIFVDDDSKDNTNNEINKIKYNNFKFLHRKKKRDLTKSCIDGIKISRFDNIVIMDGDLQHQPSCLLKMINCYEKLKPDLLVGIRKFSNLDGLNFFRKFASLLLIFFINILLKKKTGDPMSGFFIMKKKNFFKIENKLYKKGFKILCDIIYSSNDLKIIDFEIDFKKRKHNTSKMNLSVLMHIIMMIFKKTFRIF